MKICTIIVSYNFEKWLQACLSSLKNSSMASAVVVVDNASSDNTCAIIERDYPDVVLFRNPKNLGFGKANNMGMKYAIENGFDYVFLLNQDAWIERQTLEKLVSASRKNPAFGIISPIHLNGSGDKLDFGFSTYTGLKTVEDAKKLPEEITPVPFINAAMWLIPAQVLKDVGGFAPIFPHYGEDVNYCQRVRHKNYKIGFAANAFGCHDREYRKTSRQKFFYSEYIYFLTETVNPFHSPSKAFAYSVLAAKKKSLISLFSGKFNNFLRYIAIAFRLPLKVKDICETRKITARKGAHFLH